MTVLLVTVSCPTRPSAGEIETESSPSRLACCAEAKLRLNQCSLIRRVAIDVPMHRRRLAPPLLGKLQDPATFKDGPAGILDLATMRAAALS